MIRSGLRRVASGVKRRIVRRLHREPPVRSAAAPVSAPAASTVAPASTPSASAPADLQAPVSPLASSAPSPTTTADTDTASDAAAEGELTREIVWELFEDMVRPALQADGGDIDLVKVESNDVYVRLLGACHGCPSSTITMRQGIERLLREEFPQFGELIQVDGGPGLDAALEAAAP